MKRLTLFFLFLSYLSVGFGQSYTLNFSSINNKATITNSISPYVFKDSRGLLWVSTIDGLNIFDGQNTQTYKPNTKTIEKNKEGFLGNIIQGSFYEDRNADIWFTSYNAINCYRRKTKTFEHFFLSDKEGNRITMNYKGAFFDKNENFWIQIMQNLEQYDLYTFDTKNGTSTKQAETKRYIGFSEQNNSVKVVGALNEKQIVLYEFQNKNIKKQIFDLSFIDFALSFLIKGNEIYFTSTKGFFLYDCSNQKQTLLLQDEFTSILPIDNDNLFLVSSMGITIYNKTKRRLEVFTPNHELGFAQAISFLYMDKDKGLWATNEYSTSNIYYCNLKANTFSTIKNVSNGVLRSNFLCNNRKNEVLVMDIKSAKISFLHPETKQIIREIAMPEKPAMVSPSIVVDKNNDIWYSLGLSLYRYDMQQSKWKEIANPLCISTWKLEILADNRIILCTDSGLYEVANNKIIPINILDNIATDITEIFQDTKGQIHISQNATEYLIAQFVDPQTLKIVKRIPLGGFFNNHWEDVDKDEIWLATNFGIVKLDGKNYHFTIYNEKNGIPNQFIATLYPDKSERLWAATGKGIIAFDLKTNQCQSFDKSSGLITDEFLINNAIMTTNHEIWFGGKDAILTFIPDSIKSSTYQPPIHVFSFKVNDIERQDINANETIPISINYDENNISLQLTAIDFSGSEKTKIAYLLENWDSKWDTCITANGFIRYSNLSPGQYYLHLASCNADGVWASEINKISIYIKPPFYKTWWFMSICFLLLSGAAYYFYLSQIRRVKEEERKKGEFNTTLINSELKALKAQINPHFFNNCLNSISNFILKNDTDNAFFYLTKFSRLVRLVLEHSNVNFIKLSDEIAALNYYLEMESLRFSSKFEYKIEINENIDTNVTLVSPMLVQPFVENSIWHGLLPKQGGIVVITFEKEGNYIKCTIWDDGIGRKKAAQNTASMESKRKSYGMTLIQDRLKLLYATDKDKPKDVIQIIDLYDDENNAMGTKIVMKIPTQIRKTQNN
jgi:ligand-binding sensor domain-containing protein